MSTATRLRLLQDCSGSGAGKNGRLGQGVLGVRTSGADVTCSFGPLLHHRLCPGRCTA